MIGGLWKIQTHIKKGKSTNSNKMLKYDHLLTLRVISSNVLSLSKY